MLGKCFEIGDRIVRIGDAVDGHGVIAGGHDLAGSDLSAERVVIGHVDLGLLSRRIVSGNEAVYRKGEVLRLSVVDKVEIVVRHGHVFRRYLHIVDTESSVAVIALVRDVSEIAVHKIVRGAGREVVRHAVTPCICVDRRGDIHDLRTVRDLPILGIG